MTSLSKMPDTLRSDNSIKINVTWDLHMEKSF